MKTQEQKFDCTTNFKIDFNNSESLMVIIYVIVS